MRENDRQRQSERDREREGSRESSRVRETEREGERQRDRVRETERAVLTFLSIWNNFNNRPGHGFCASYA